MHVLNYVYNPMLDLTVHFYYLKKINFAINHDFFCTNAHDNFFVLTIRTLIHVKSMSRAYTCGSEQIQSSPKFKHQASLKFLLMTLTINVFYKWKLLSHLSIIFFYYYYILANDFKKLRRRSWLARAINLLWLDPAASGWQACIPLVLLLQFSCYYDTLPYLVDKNAPDIKLIQSLSLECYASIKLLLN